MWANKNLYEARLPATESGHRTYAKPNPRPAWGGDSTPRHTGQLETYPRTN